jgi:hypothetical protein
METYIIWGWILVATTQGMPPIVDPNFTDGDECEQVKSDFLTSHPEYQAYCFATWKPDHARTRRIVRVVHRRHR